MSEKEEYRLVVPIDTDHELQIEVELSIRGNRKWIKVQAVSDMGERLALSEWVRS